MQEQTGPRRARKNWWTLRVASLAIPAALVGLLTAGVAVSVWPESDSIVAAPAAAADPATPSAAARDNSADRTTRLLANGRPALIDGSAAAAQADAAQKKAAEEKAAEKKAADKKAEKKEAADKKEAKKKAEAEEKAAAKKKAEAKKKAALVTPTAAQLKVTGKRYTRVALNVRKQPANKADLVTVLSAGSKLSVTDTTKGSWTLVIHNDKGRWVHSEYLTKSKPKPAKSKASSTGGGLSMAKCSKGSGMESGLTRDAIRVHRAVCAEFGSVKSYGGMRSGGDSFHTSGRAVDIMIPSASTGRSIADWVRAHRKALGVSEVIYAQKIWTVQRGSEGWRHMSDRGNATANHYDHVHVSVYGNRGSI
ncbi:MAG: SH3 domain-containing protein [Propionibacteriaceae bacterium]